MATQTRQQQGTRPMPPPQNAVAILAPPRLLPPDDKTLQEYDVNREGWRTLTESIFPAAKSTTSVMMALDYCRRRKLDVFKHPVHIVPIWNSQAGENGNGAMVETIWPGINELRTTAIRTGQYAGMDVPVFGAAVGRHFEGKIKKWNNGSAFYETVTADVTFPEWCQITVYRTLGGNRVPFPGPRVYWLETYARLRNDCEVPNSMWEKRANGQLEKCAEAAALRRAFPEELGSDYSIDEIGAFTTHAPTDVTNEGSATVSTVEPKRGDPQYQAQPEAAISPVAPAESGQTAAAPAGAGGDSKPKAASTPADITDVVDENDKDPRKPAPGEKLTFGPLGAKEFMAFAEDFLPNTNADGAQQFGLFYGQQINAMELGSANAKGWAKWCRDQIALAQEPGAAA